MHVLMMKITPIHEHSICFHLFMSSLISFFSVVQFSEYKSFTSLVRIIPRCFIFLVAMANGILSLILFLIFHCCTKMPLIAKYRLCVPQLCLIHLLGQLDFWWHLQDFLCTLSCHMKMRVLLPLFQFGCRLFLFLV